jgi:putative ubiquitin-RnfH superfamily antitoxin RatB of RatAB toxin-antitoxin module
MAPDQMLGVEIACATKDEQIVIALSVPRGTTVGEAIALADFEKRGAGPGATRAAVGIYGKVVGTDTVLCDGDRIELYRPLLADPKQARRRRAAERT